MSSKSETISTIEELVAYVTTNTYNADRKWKLEDRSDTRWVDPEDGDAWETEKDNFLHSVADREGKRRVSQWDLAGEDKEKYEEIANRRPPQVQVTTYHLNEAGNHPGYILLSEALGDMLDGIWKHKPMFRGSSYNVRTGQLTIPGMLKRLGQTDVGEQVAKAKADAELARAKSLRNSWRTSTWKTCEDFLGNIDRAAKVEGALSPLAVEILKNQVALFMAAIPEQEE